MSTYDLTVYEFTTVASIVLHMCMLIMALIAYSYIQDKKSWRWFILAALLVLIRRALALVGVAMDVSTVTWQSGTTILITLFWIVYIWERCKYGKRNDASDNT
jgi:hypothetical protein